MKAVFAAAERKRRRWAYCGVVPERDDTPTGRSEVTKIDAFLIANGEPVPIYLETSVRCRRCTSCLRERRRAWEKRMFAEAVETEARGARVWFGTITCSPDYLTRARAHAYVYCREEGKDFDALSLPDQAMVLDRVCWADVSKYFKRLRNGEAGVASRFRYLAVTEVTAAGAPHWHVLLCEMDPLHPLRKRVLDASAADGGFVGGHTHWRLWKHQSVHHKFAGLGYITKYLTKESGCKLRASLHFGAFCKLPVSTIQNEWIAKPDGGTMDPVEDGCAQPLGCFPPNHTPLLTPNLHLKGGEESEANGGHLGALVVDKQPYGEVGDCSSGAKIDTFVKRVKAVFGEGCEVIVRSPLEAGLSTPGAGAIRGPPNTS